MQTRVWLAIGLAIAAAGCGAHYARNSDRIVPAAGANVPAELWAVQQPSSNLDTNGGQREGVAGRTAPAALAKSKPRYAPATADKLVQGSPIAARSVSVANAPSLDPVPPGPVPSVALVAPQKRTRSEPPRIVEVRPSPGARAADMPSALEQPIERSFANSDEIQFSKGTEEGAGPLVGNLRTQSSSPKRKSSAEAGRARISSLATGNRRPDESAVIVPEAPPATGDKPPVPPEAKTRIAGVGRKMSAPTTRPESPANPPATAAVSIPTVTAPLTTAGSNGPARASSPAPPSVALKIPKAASNKKAVLPPLEKIPIDRKARDFTTERDEPMRPTPVPAPLREAFASKKKTKEDSSSTVHADLGPAFAKLADAKSPAIKENSVDDDTVTVYYGTDRKIKSAEMDWQNPFYVFKVCMAIGGASMTVVFAGMAFMFSGREKLLAFVALALCAAVAIPASQSVRSVGRLVSYGGERGELVMGACTVTIPKNHKTGQLERPSVLRLEFQEDARKHIVLQSVKQQECSDCMGEIQKCVKASPNGEAFVFIHGYNVGFEEAAQRTAQIAHDLEFKGAAIMFSWPSQGGLFKYTIDETNVQWSVPHLIEFLTKLSKDSGAKTIHLIAHSMGNRALVAALQKFAADAAVDDKAPRFNEVVLAAPDIDADIFKRQIAPAILKAADRLTLYASATDRALLASRKVHGYPRAGDTGRDLVIVPGIDTIDVSAVDMSLLGHDYYGSNPAILNDIWGIFRDRKQAAERTHLRQMQANGLPYWVFVPQLARAGGSLTVPR